MRRFVTVATVVAAVGVFQLSGLPSEAQEAVTIQQSPELKVLGRLVGSWQWQLPSPLRSTGQPSCDGSGRPMPACESEAWGRQVPRPELGSQE